MPPEPRHNPSMRPAASARLAYAVPATDALPLTVPAIVAEGLGPALAGITQRVDAARGVLASDPPTELS